MPDRSSLPTISDRRIASIVSVLRADFRRRPTLSEIASSVNLSTSRLRHLFKSQVGVTPSKFIKIKKFHEAKKLAERTYLSVKEIVSLVGGNDESHFLRDFKKVYGRTLGDFQMRARKKGRS